MKLLVISVGYPSEHEPYKYVFVQRLVNELVDHGNECTVICPTRTKLFSKGVDRVERQITAKGNEVEVFFPHFTCIYTTSRFKGDFIRKFSVNNCVNAVKRCIAENKIEFDAVYAHFLGEAAICAIEVGKQYGKKTVAAAGESHFTDFDSKDKDSIIKKLRELDGIVSVSSQNKKILIKNGVASEDNIITVPNGVDTCIFYPHDRKESRKAFGFSPSDFIVGFTGYFIDRKGPDRVLAASDGLDLKIAFAGKGELKPKLKGSNVIYCDSVDPKQMSVFLSACDIFVLPTKDEGCCNAIIEAMACGLPIVSSNREFNDDILNEECSLRIDPEDIGQIHDAIAELRNNDELRQRLSEGAVGQGRSLSISERANRIADFIAKTMEG